MNRKFLISWAVIFVVWMVGSFLVHGFLLSAGYSQLPDLFRPQDEANQYFHFMLVAHLVFTGAIVWIYQRGNEQKPWLAQGVRFGLAMAAIAPIPKFAIYYVVQPMPGNHVIMQIVYESILLIALGILLAFLNKGEAET